MARLSLTKAQVSTGAGAELLALCQSATSDGRLGKSDLAALLAWRKAHGSAEFPGAAFLRTLLDRITADGRIDSAELAELHRGLEAILPPELRAAAVAARRGEESARRAAAKEEAASARTAERDARAALRPMERFNFMLAGVSFGDRQRTIRARIREGSAVLLIREPQNRHARGGVATAVALPDGRRIGYVPAEDAPALSAGLDACSPYTASVTKVLGSTMAIPVVEVALFRPGAQVPGAALAGGPVAPAARARLGPVAIAWIAAGGLLALALGSCLLRSL